MSEQGYTQEEFSEADAYLFYDHVWRCDPGPRVTAETFEVDVENAVRASGLPEAAIRAALTVAVKKASTIESLNVYQGIFLMEDMSCIEIENRPGPYYARVPTVFKEIVREYMKAQKKKKRA